MQTSSENISRIKISRDQLLKLVKISTDLPDLDRFDIISDGTDTSVVVLDFITIDIS